jgi:hypothetical protein
MAASTQIFLDKSFVLKIEDVQKLALAFSTWIGPPTLELDCSDGIARSFDTVDAVIQYENPVSKSIRSFRIRAYSKDMLEKATFSLSARDSSSMFISLEGVEQHVREVKEAIDDRIDAMRPWYSWLTRMDFITMAIFGCLFGYLALLVLIALGGVATPTPKPATDDPRGTAVAFLIVFGVFAAALVGGWLGNIIRNTVFPKGTFAIGQGEERFRRQENIRWVVIVGFLVSLAAGCLPLLFTR